MGTKNGMPIVIWSRRNNEVLLDLLLEEWTAYASEIGLKVIVVTDSVKEYPVDVVRFQEENWKSEWSQVLEKLKSDGYTRIISVLDDFHWLKGPTKQYINEINGYIEKNSIDYLALEPNPSHANLLSMWQKSNRSFAEYLGDEAYPSSLRPSVWSIDLFGDTLSRVDDIWQFEHVFLKRYKYATVLNRRLRFRVRHVMEKGKLNYNSLGLGLESFLALKKRYAVDWASFVHIPRDIIIHFLIFIFGYRIHNKLKRIRV